MPVIYMDFASAHWRFETGGPWSVIRERPHIVEARHPGGAVTAGQFAAARLTVPVYSAPLQTFLRFVCFGSCPTPDAPAAAPVEGIPSPSGLCFVRATVSGRTVWEQDVTGLPVLPRDGFFDVSATEPGGGHYDIEFVVEYQADAQDAPPVCVCWALPRVELVGFGEQAEQWGPTPANLRGLEQ